MSAALSARASEVLALQHLSDADIMAQLGMTAGAVRLYRTELRRGGAAVTVTIDPLAELFPAVTGADFDALVADIRTHGLREKIVRSGLAVLDSRNRFRACIAAGLSENPVPMAALGQYFRPLRADEGDPLAFVLSANLTRRHLTESQRALVAARLATMGVGRPKRAEDAPHPNPLPADAGRGGAPVLTPIRADDGAVNSANLQNFPGMSAEQAADALHVSTRSTMTARHVLASAAPELVAAVEAGDVSLHAAESLVERPHAEQSEIVARGREEILKAAKQFRAVDQAEKARRRAEKEAALAVNINDSNAALAAIGAAGRRYGVVLADPEWQFEPWSAVTGMDRAADNHYPCSPLETIMARPVADLAARDADWADALTVAAAARHGIDLEPALLSDYRHARHKGRSPHEAFDFAKAQQVRHG